MRMSIGLAMNRRRAGGSGPGPMPDPPTQAWVETLRTSNVNRGVPAGTTLKTLGVDTLPAGVSNSTGSRTVTISGADVVLDGWNLGPRFVVIESTATNFTIRNCLFYNNGTLTLGANRLVDIYPGANGSFERCGFFGMGWYGLRDTDNAIVQRASGTDHTNTVAGNLTITGCEFIGFGGDYLKTAGGGEISGNYFDIPTNAPQGTLPWSAATTYNTGDRVFDATGTFMYVSATDGNLNNALPSGKTSNANWTNSDPHSDLINPFLAAAPMLIRGNYILRDPRAGILGPDQRQVGVTQGIRTSINSGSLLLHDVVTSEYNIISAGWPINSSTPLGASSADGVQKIADVFQNNWIGATEGGLIFPASGSTGNTVTGNTTDYAPTATPAAQPAVYPVNALPVAGADSGFNVVTNTPLDIAVATLLANDTDVDFGTLSITGVTNGTGGTVALVGSTITFTPTTDYTGAASFTYTLSDGQGGTAVGTVSLTVAAAPWVPSDISGLEIWYDFSDTATLTGDPGVTAVTDKSASGYDLVSATSAPTRSTIGSRVALDFNGTSQSLRNTTATISPTAKTIGVVYVADSTTGATLIRNQNASGADRFNVTVTSARMGDVATVNYTPTLSVVQTLVVTSSGPAGGDTTVEPFLDGVSQGTSTGALSAFASQIGVGNFPTGTARFNGRIGEIVVYDRVLSAGELADLTTYLDRWKS